MLPDRVSNPGPLTYESGALPIALRGPAFNEEFSPRVPLAHPHNVQHFWYTNYAVTQYEI